MASLLRYSRIAWREETIYAVRTLLSKALEDGEKREREAILIKMEELRKSVPEQQEYILLEVMDFLVGLVQPPMRSYEARCGRRGRLGLADTSRG